MTSSMESLKGFKFTGAIVVLVNFMHGGGTFRIFYLTICSSNVIRFVTTEAIGWLEGCKFAGAIVVLIGFVQGR